jgi:hypothetical protein
MNLRHYQLFALLLTLSLSIVFYSCRKDKETIANVLVVNEDGNPVPGATVRLYGKPSPNSESQTPVRFDTLGTTNGAGKVSFNFSDYYKQGQAGFAVLDIQVCKGTLAGTGIIKIEEEVTNEESVKVEIGICLIED